MFWTAIENNPEYDLNKNSILRRRHTRIKMTNKVDCSSVTENKCKLHTVTRPILITCRCVGLFPVAGLFSSTTNELRTSIISLYSIICLVAVLGQLSLSIVATAYLISSGISVRVVHKFLVLLGGAFCTIITQKLAWNWPKLVQEASVIENCLPKFNLKNITRLSTVAAIVILICAVVEVILSIRFYARIADACSVNTSSTAFYYKYTMPACSMVIPYSTITFIILQIMYYQSIFMANFADLFIIVISIYLSSYLEEFNDMVFSQKDKYPGTWSVLRVHFTKLTKLCKVIDDRISMFVLFSFGSNLSITCVQLFKVLRKDLAHGFTSECDAEKVHETLNSYDRALYFSFTIIYLLVRSFTTAMFASKVHSAAKEPIMTLYDIPSSNFNSEAQRFVDQLHGSNIALSGLHFFYVTRSMILSMIAAIFTYELVMLQFLK